MKWTPLIQVYIGALVGISGAILFNIFHDGYLEAFGKLIGVGGSIVCFHGIYTRNNLGKKKVIDRAVEEYKTDHSDD